MGRRPSQGEDLVPLPVAGRPVEAAHPAPIPGAGTGLRPLVGVGALLAALVLGGALTGIDRGGHRRAVNEQAAARPPSAGAPVADEPAPAGWRRGSPGPLRHRDGAVEVWTGRELLIWGGDPDGDTGAAYNPAADRWRTLPTSSIPARCGATSAWTGRDLLVWGPSCSAGGPTAAAALTAGGPAGGDRWRTLPAGPLPGGGDPVSAWTGTEWLVLTPSGRAAAFDPGAGAGGTSGRGGAWRSLPAAPRRFTAATAAWTGRELLVAGWEAAGSGPAPAGPVFRHWAAALDPPSGRWRALPDPPLELATTAVWDGRRLLAWDQNLHAVALDPAGRSGWQRLPDLPVDFTDCSPRGALVGGVVFAEECGRGALFRPAAGLWVRIPHPRSLAETPVWTGHDALFWIGRFAGSADGTWLYRPPATAGRAPGSPGGGRSAAPG